MGESRGNDSPINPKRLMSLLRRHPQRHPGPPSNVTLERHPPSSDHLFDTPRLGRQGRRALRGAGTVGDPPGRLVPRLTIRPPLLALAALASLTASSGGGIGLPAPDVGPTGLGPHPTSGALSRSTMAVGVRYPTGSQQGPCAGALLSTGPISRSPASSRATMVPSPTRRTPLRGTSSLPRRGDHRSERWNR